MRRTVRAPGVPAWSSGSPRSAAGSAGRAPGEHRGLRRLHGVTRTLQGSAGGSGSAHRGGTGRSRAAPARGAAGQAAAREPPPSRRRRGGAGPAAGSSAPRPPLGPPRTLPAPNRPPPTPVRCPGPSRRSVPPHPSPAAAQPAPGTIWRAGPAARWRPPADNPPAGRTLASPARPRPLPPGPAHDPAPPARPRPSRGTRQPSTFFGAFWQRFWGIAGAHRPPAPFNTPLGPEHPWLHLPTNSNSAAGRETREKPHAFENQKKKKKRIFHVNPLLWGMTNHFQHLLNTSC